MCVCIYIYIYTLFFSIFEYLFCPDWNYSLFRIYWIGYYFIYIYIYIYIYINVGMCVCVYVQVRETIIIHTTYSILDNKYV